MPPARAGDVRACQRQTSLVFVVPALSRFMLEIEIDGDEFGAGWHTDQRFGTSRPPRMNNLGIGACVLKSVGCERRLGIFAAEEDANPSLRQL
jgi:hypothetical protein